MNISFTDNFNESLETDYRASFEDFNNFVQNIKLNDIGK